ncbi:hypothetical protein ACA910_020800 [Epithemia clementina (nom. ined.)]
MVEERLDRQLRTSDEDEEEEPILDMYFDVIEITNVAYDDAEETVAAMEAELALLEGNTDPRLQFLDDILRFLTHTQKVVHERWARVYNKEEHHCLKKAITLYLKNNDSV